MLFSSYYVKSEELWYVKNCGFLRSGNMCRLRGKGPKLSWKSQDISSLMTVSGTWQDRPSNIRTVPPESGQLATDFVKFVTHNYHTANSVFS